MSNTLINASNLHVGGGVQVAVSAISELYDYKIFEQEQSIAMSSEVARNLMRNVAARHDIHIVDVFGLKQPRLVRRLMNHYGAVLTVFGPLYRWKPPFRSIVGFAQPWIIYPQNECYAQLPLCQRLRTRIKFKIQAFFFKQADELIVELAHVKEGLVRELNIPPDRIHVVHNCLSTIFRDPTLWAPCDIPDTACDLRLGFLGRNYPHKNTGIFPQIVNELRANHNINARFYVTFTEDEWRACTPAFREACINVGPISAAQCPTFYRALDAVVFPSLLECFSATPLEAMAMERPLFASDRPFNRDICGDHAHYFDPLDPKSAAAEIAKIFKDGSPSPERLRVARDHAIGFSSPKDRAMRYMEILENAARL